MQHPYVLAAHAAHTTRLILAGSFLRLLLLLPLLPLLLLPGTARAQGVIITGPTGSGFFGASVTVLPNGNYVVTDPGYDAAGVAGVAGTADVGAVYLYRGTDNTLLSTLTGSTASDEVGGGGITVLSNGNFVVRTSTWDNGAALNVGAVTWGSASTGVSGAVSAVNSLVGTTADDWVGNNGVVVLPNGNYVVSSTLWNNGATSATDAGAVTWGNGTGGTAGAVSAANSLVGTTGNDQVGGSIVVLTNGNYVVSSSDWNNGLTALDAGAVTWGNGAGGTVGAVATANSLIGTTSGDFVGGSVVALPNGNYVMGSPNWDNASIVNAGAAMWGNGMGGTVWVINATNSLVGTIANDNVGGNIVTLPNGNYVVGSPNWDNASLGNAGAATWGNGAGGTEGAVSTANSLVGTRANDNVGSGGVVALSNGNYVVGSPNWDNGSAVLDAGAATWGNGASGTAGAVSATNSFVGTTGGDFVGTGIVALPNGNYVVRSPNWDNGSATANVGAVTWGSASTGVSGAVSTANSLVGTKANDNVGSGGVVALSNGNYVVGSPNWDNGSAVLDAGAATWGNGASGTVGEVSAANSLVGTTGSDQVSLAGVVALPNGHYVVRSPNWDNGSIGSAGAATWGNGAGGTVGAVSTANSLVGTTGSDQVSLAGVVALPNGNYVVRSNAWDNGAAATEAGAVTWGNGAGGTAGTVSAANSLVGTTTNDNVGSNDVVVQPDGSYVVGSPSWDNGSLANAGALTLGNGAGPTIGSVTACNSIVGGVASGGVNLVAAYRAAQATLLGGRRNENKVQVGTGAPAAPSGAASQHFASGATVADLVATGTAVQFFAAPSGGAALAPATALAHGTTYYAGQTVGGCPSFGRLAIAVTLTAPAVTLATSAVVGTVFCAGAVLDVPYTATGTFAAGNVFTAQLSDAAGSFAAPVAVGTLASPALSGIVVAIVPVGTGTGSGYRLRVVASAPAATGPSNGTDLAVTATAPDATTQYLAAASTTQAAPVSAGVQRFFADANCRGIAALRPTGAAMGSTTSAVYVQAAAPTYGTRAYVRRYYDVSPATNAATATATLTLYFTQADFTNYNAANGSDPDLPTGPADAAGIGSLRLMQQHGTSATGLPGTFTGWAGPGPATVVLNPADTSIGWNASESRWEVTVDVTGFSGFFAYGEAGSAPLPVELTAFTATLQGNAAVRLAWTTASEKNSARFEVERSADGSVFKVIGTVAAAGTSSTPRSYALTDAKLPAGRALLYYRLRQVDADSTFAYSSVRSVALKGAVTGLVLYPNPASSGAATLTGAQPGTVVTVFDALGRAVTSAPADATGTAALKLPAGLPLGVYVVRAGTQALRLSVE